MDPEHASSVDRQHAAASRLRWNARRKHPGHTISEPALPGESLRPHKWNNHEHGPERGPTSSFPRLFTFGPKLLDGSRALDVQRPADHAHQEDGTWLAATGLVHIRKVSDRRHRQRTFSERRQPPKRQPQFRAGLGPG